MGGRPEPTKPKVITHPRVGGIDEEGEIWIGGSNISAEQMTEWSSINQFSPKGFKNGKTAFERAIKRLKEENTVGLPHEKDFALFTMWVKDIGNHLEEDGMDTVC